MTKPMKRREVETALRRQGCQSGKPGGPHETWHCPDGDHTTYLPRHREITAGVCNNIVKQLPCLPKGWLQ